jgi:hypothetical protein
MSEHADRLWDISFGCKLASSQREAARAALRLAVKRRIGGGQPRSELPPPEASNGLKYWSLPSAGTWPPLCRAGNRMPSPP